MSSVTNPNKPRLRATVSPNFQGSMIDLFNTKVTLRGCNLVAINLEFSLTKNAAKRNLSIIENLPEISRQSTSNLNMLFFRTLSTASAKADLISCQPNWLFNDI